MTETATNVAARNMEKLKIFITWSGPRSRAVAEALRDWLPSVFQLVEPWLSAADIDKGAKWSQAITGELEKANFGIICLTPENLTAPWILFEAGALSKKAGASVCTYLFGLTNTDLKDPLSQFQWTEATKADTMKLAATINKALGSNALPSERLQEAFELWWPKLEKRLNQVPAPPGEVTPERTMEDKIDEILTLVREENNTTTRVLAMKRAMEAAGSRSDLSTGYFKDIDIESLKGPLQKAMEAVEVTEWVKRGTADETARRMEETLRQYLTKIDKSPKE